MCALLRDACNFSVMRHLLTRIAKTFEKNQYCIKYFGENAKFAMMSQGHQLKIVALQLILKVQTKNIGMDFE